MLYEELFDSLKGLAEVLCERGDHPAALEVLSAVEHMLHEDDREGIMDEILSSERASIDAVRSSAQSALGERYTGPVPGGR